MLGLLLSPEGSYTTQLASVRLKNPFLCNLLLGDPAFAEEIDYMVSISPFQH